MKFSVLHIFTHFGRTYTFRNGEIVCSNEAILEFNYTAMSDGLVKKATFPLINIAGWSIVE